MGNRWDDRRKFLQLAAGAAVGAGLPPGVAKALALPANRVTGTIRDVEHVVILMQENRSFDHYFGTMRGVRGYGDPRPIDLPSGQPVWNQPAKDGAGTVGPFHLDTATTRAETMFSLDHSWKGAHAKWKHYDAWIPAKGPLTMGYFSRADIPFYYALADAFTVCDGYFCSIFAQTNPNRLFLFSGTSGLSAGDDSKIVVANPPEETNETADSANDAKAFRPLTWPTYAERLQAAGVSWRVYQEYDNFGDNGLAYFANFRGKQAGDPLHDRARTWAPGANAANAKTSDGEHLVAQFAADVAADRLPQVSWIVPSTHLSEHPSASPSDGAWLTARLISALAANPKVWAKTVFILNYDENDGFFDHVPPPIPAVGAAPGKSTVDLAHENYHGEPVGLGPRVPMIVVSPWTKGGWVNSEVFDHTSVIRFLEARFGVMEPQISPWRRAVCGDLTSVFDFKTPNGSAFALPDASGLPARADKAKALPFPKAPAVDEKLPRQEPGQRPARALPYQFQVASPSPVRRALPSPWPTPARPAPPSICGPPTAVSRASTPWSPASGWISDRSPRHGSRRLRLGLHGPNGFLRGFRGEMGAAARSPAANGLVRRPKAGKLRIGLRNEGSAPLTLEVKSAAYLEHRFAAAPVSPRRIGHGRLGAGRQPQLVRLRRHLRRGA